MLGESVIDQHGREAAVRVVERTAREHFDAERLEEIG